MYKLPLGVTLSCALLAASPLVIAKSPTGSFYTNLGATVVSDGSDSENGYFAQLGYSHYLSPFLSVDINYRHTATNNGSVSSAGDGFSSKYDSYGGGLKIQRGVGAFEIYGTGGASYIDSEVTRWSITDNAAITSSESSVEPYANAGIIFAVQGSPLVLDAGVSYQWLPGGESATSFYGGAYLNF